MKIYQSNLLNQFKNITHAFTTKDGGISKDPYSSLNLAFHVGDKPLDVEKNHQLLAHQLGYDKNSLVHMKQIHSSDVHNVIATDNFTNPKECDALICNKLNTPLMVMVADCAPILFYDPIAKVIAVAHAGRAGVFKNIVKKVIENLKQSYNSQAKNIYVSIGANIKECCYEVGKEVYQEAKELQLEYAMALKKNSYHLNINKILRHQLLEAGVKEVHMEFANECTSCHKERYFSYRAEGVTGRFCGVIMLH